MNNENNKYEFTQFLAKNNDRRQPERNQQFKVIDYFRFIAIHEEPDNKLYLRFNELMPKAKIRFCLALIADTSLITVKRLSIEEILKRLTTSNPIIAENWRSSFCLGSFPRLKERRLSSLIYHLGRKYDNSNNRQRNLINHLIN